MAVAGTGRWYGQALMAALRQELNVTADTLKMSLHTATYVPSQDGDAYQDDLTGEIVGTGYTAGGATLTGVALTYDAATNVVKIDCDDVTWADSTIADAAHAVIYDDTPATAATKPLLGYISFAEPVSSTSGAFTVTMSSDGLLTGTVGA